MGRVRILVNGDLIPDRDPAKGPVDRDLASFYASYLRAVEEAGGLPIPLPPSPPELLREYYALADGVVLTGNPEDYPPRFYGSEPHPRTVKARPERAESDLALAKLCLEGPKPVLGICAGLQILSIAAGGALIQHLETGLRHENEQRYKDSAHEIAIDPGSRLASVFPSSPMTVNSSHHQAAEPKRLGAGLRASARAPDGVVEALEREPGGPFLLAVQWHPERIEDDEHRRRLFARFVDACRGGVRA